MSDNETEQGDEQPPDSGGESADPTQALREDIEEKYDFENFTPRDMAEMTPEEWEAAFDPETWITGTELLDRAEADLKARVASRDVFAVVEREHVDGEERLVAYSDEGYAIVYQDGSVEGEGTVLRDVKPTVALASMSEYEVPDPPTDAELPHPDDVTEAGGELGNRVIQVVAGLQVAVGALLVLAPFVVDPLIRRLCRETAAVGAYACSIGSAEAVVYPFGQSAILATFAGLGFIVFGLFLFLVVANARLSNRFRREAYRNRLRSAGVDSGERPSFLPDDGEK